MESPLNKKIERSLEREAAKKKKNSNYIPVLTLRQQVLSLVSQANKSVQSERQVTPRSALIVMDRALASLAVVDEEARDFAVLREVSSFISTAQKTTVATASTHVDLLPQGHPLSALNASLTPDEYRFKYSQWLSADADVSSAARPLVAAAFSSQPGSIERAHAFMRLSITTEKVPGYFKLDPAPIIAAFSTGNSSAARRARVALQWRDKKGRWVEMGRGVNFRFRLPDGSIQVGRGNYVGSGGDTRVENTAEGSTLVSDSGLIEVSGVPGLESGLYVINSDNAAVYQARIPGYAAPEEPSFKDQFDEAIPSVEDLVATRRKLPIGWKDDGAFYISDDNYAVVPNVNGRPQSVLRLDANGRPSGGSIGSVSSWSDVNAVIQKDQPEFDKEIARLEGDELPLGRIPGATQEDVISAEDILKMQEQRGQENKKFDEAEPVAPELGENDLNGNVVPAEWTRDADDDKAYTRQLPLRDGGTYPVIARLNDDGTYIAGHAAGWIPEAGSDGRGPSQKFDSWDQIEAEGLPDFVEYLNDTFTKDNPIEFNAPKDSGLDDEPPAPPSGGVQPKTPSPTTPTAPGLFADFDVPQGAFKFNTAEYDVQGRVDERSTDFTDDPEKLANKFTVQDLISAFSESIVGNTNDAVVAEILNVNLGDDDELDAPSEVDVNVEMPQVELGRPSGAGQLEFNAGAEFVPAESLFNALWHAGVDPNRVLANVYDSVTGDNKNLSKLIEAQGGTPSAEEAQLVDDITAEIRQIKDGTSEDEPSIANQKDTPSPELEGALIENIAIDFENPDYYIPDPSAYISSQDTPDDNGYTDNPEILATDYETSDLIMQMLEGITDGSGAALLNFGDITTEVPIEAIRDALQLQNVNTNDILVDLKRESNDMSEPDSEPAALQVHSQMIKDLIEQAGNTVDDETADKIRDAINQEGLLDWSEADDAEIIEAITEVAGPGILTGGTPEETVEEAPEVEDAPVDSPEAETPQFVYPGPREAGYTANNTVLGSNGVAIGAGSRIQALSDGRVGTIVAVQNIDTKSGRDADYARIRFDDGSTAVRSARQIFGIDGGAPVAQAEQGEGPGQLSPARRNPVAQEPSVRFNEPAPRGTPVIAGEGNVPGVNISEIPENVAEFANADAKQSDFAQWGLRAPEIARAGRDRVTLDNITDLVIKAQEAKVAARDANDSEKEDAIKKEEELRTQVQKLIRDAYGARKGTTFGRNDYTISEAPGVSYFISGTTDEVAQGKGEINISISFSIINKDGKQVGQGSRSLRRKAAEQQDGTTQDEWSVTNNILRIESTRDKKSGFAVAYNRYMEDWYIANGIKKIEVHAAAGGQWQGGLVWALNGFNWDGPNQARRAPVILRNMAGNRDTTQEEMQSIKRMQERIAADNPGGVYNVDTVPTPLEIAMVGWYPGAKNWAGRRAMLKVDWYGIKRLDPSTTEQRQAVNYDQMRNARQRIDDKLNRPGVSREFVLTTNSNEFADANPELAPYIDQIRDVFRSNRSLAVLSPGAKTALNRYTASQLLKGEGREVTLQDIFKLRIALDAEFKADNPLIGSKDFGVGNQLLDVSMDDVRSNSITGFTVKELGMFDSGVNDTYMVTHNDSGQIFFVKKDSYAAQFEINGPGAEVQADTMLRAAGVSAGYETRASNVDPEIIVMQRAGAGIPLLSEPMTAQRALGNRMAINMPDGTTVKITPENFMDLLHTPEDAVRVMLVDLIISNMDRHNNNLLLAVDGTDATKIRILPIDHALSTFSPVTEDIRYTVLELFDNSGNNLYGMAMPVLTERLKQDELLSLFRNEARAMMEGLNNPANLPTGKELDLVIKNFGSINAYRQKVAERIDALLNPGGEGYEDFLKILKPNYWSRNR